MKSYNSSSCQRLPAGLGRFKLVVTLLALSLLVMAGLVIHRQLTGPSRPDDKPEPYDREAALAATESLGEQFNNRIGEGAAVDTLIDEGRELVEQYPQFAQAHTLLGEMMIYANDYESAYEQLDRSLQIEPYQPEIHILAGGVQVKRGNLESAERHYLDASSIKPRESRYLLLLAGVRIQMEQFEQARQNLLKAIQLDSTNYRAYGLLSDMYARQNKIELALDQVNKAISLVPDDKSGDLRVYILKQVKLLHRAGRVEESLLILRSLPPREQLRPEVMAEIAVTQNLLGKPGDAARHYESALLVEPLSAGYALEAARWYARSGEQEKARELLSRARRINPQVDGLDEVEAMLDPQP